MKDVIVDTSVWINHLNKSNPKLCDLLKDNRVLIHPYIVGEIALGTYKDRSSIIDLLLLLPKCSIPSFDEVLIMIESKKLYGKGVGLIDVHLLAASKLSSCLLWTHDKKLKKLSVEFNCTFD